MTSKEIVRKLIRLEPTPRIPVSLLSAGAWTLNRAGLTLESALLATPERVAEVIAGTNEMAHCDIVWPGSGYHNLAIRGAGGKIKFRIKGTPDVQEPLFTDATRIDPAWAHRVQDDPGVRLLVEAARILARQIGSHTVVGTSQWAPFTLGGLAYGVENLMRGLYKDKAAVHAVLDFAADLCFAFLEPFIDAGVSVISLADPTSSGDLISREQFIEFSLPCLKKLATKIKERGVWVVVHICGNTTNRLDQIPLAGADLMSVDYKVDLAKAREILGGKIAFSGNLNPVAIMQKETPEGVAEAARQAIAKASGTQGGYLLMPGCDIPPSVPLENVKALVETAHATTL
ncbi:MAG: uroporphyrinogen decarboxylase family protein [Chthoniobacteraceae bacterium]|nr:uroporphyrinogen decarboxylase family protein [Chthoniobacteraceae bacterium]